MLALVRLATPIPGLDVARKCIGLVERQSPARAKNRGLPGNRRQLFPDGRITGLDKDRNPRTVPLSNG